MSEFFQQLFCDLNESYSLIIEDDGKVAYAYLMNQDDIIGDIWLYNQGASPQKIDWNDTNNMPLMILQGILILTGCLARMLMGIAAKQPK